MKRLPHLVTRYSPTTITDAYGDTVDGPLAQAGDPFRGWLQTREIRESVTGVVTTQRTLYTRPSAPRLTPKDEVEVEGLRYRIDGEEHLPVRPSGRPEFRYYRVTRVTRGE